PSPPRTAEEVFQAFAPRVYNLARRLLGHEADAEDVTQDVLLLVVRKLHTFRGEAGLGTWLHRVTVNAALMLRRRRARRPERRLPGARPPGARAGGGPRGWAEARGLRQAIEGAVARLPAMYRDVLVLADIEGLPNAEVGETLGLSLPAVKSRLHRA